jgi:hypothetical protein
MEYDSIRRSGKDGSGRVSRRRGKTASWDSAAVLFLGGTFIPPDDWRFGLIGLQHLLACDQSKLGFETA